MNLSRDQGLRSTDSVDVKAKQKTFPKVNLQLCFYQKVKRKAVKHYIKSQQKEISTIFFFSHFHHSSLKYSIKEAKVVWNIFQLCLAAALNRLLEWSSPCDSLEIHDIFWPPFSAGAGEKKRRSANTVSWCWCWRRKKKKFTSSEEKQFVGELLWTEE